MDATIASLSAAGLILLISIIAAYMPFRFTNNQKLQSRILTLSSGIMIGVLFIMMIPEAMERVEAEGHDHVFCSELMMMGFLFILSIGYVIYLFRIKSDNDDISSKSTWIAFCVDAAIDGAVVATGMDVGGGTEIAILMAMCLHKGVEVFALTNLIISSSKVADAKKMMAIYCLICPLALIICGLVVTHLLSGISGLALCFSAGVFMYASLSDMVPKTFEGENRRGISTAIVFAAGIMVTVLVNQVTIGL